MKNFIIIKDWAGNILFQGDYKSKKVDLILDDNRCGCDFNEECMKCEGSGYTGDFTVHWEDEKDKRNVYEYINY